MKREDALFPPFDPRVEIAVCLAVLLLILVFAPVVLLWLFVASISAVVVFCVFVVLRLLFMAVSGS